MYICTSEQARDEDQRAQEVFHIPSLVLMEHAAIECVNQMLPWIKDKKIAILVGPGNNGGDGLAIARLLYQKGISTSIYMPSLSMSESESVQYGILKALNISIEHEDESILDDVDFIIDALFGNGLSRPIEGKWANLIQKVNDSKASVIAIDVPSGLDGSSGKILGTAIQADITLALDCIKQGQLIRQGKACCGKIIPLDIGIPHPSFKATKLLDPNKIQIPYRSDDSHKGSFGKALMIGGSQSMHGAITMASKAAYLSGIGTLTIMLPDCIADILAYKMDSAMRLICPSEKGYFGKESLSILEKNIKNYDVISLGNGLGREPVTIELLKLCLKSNKALILDADAFWALQECTDLLNREAPTILTPHMKEFSTFMHMDLKEVLDDPFHASQIFSQRYPNCTLILKSSMTILCENDKTYVLNQANSSLAKGGSGDLLCGILVGIYGQCKKSLESATTACLIHSQAANQGIDPASFQPEDLLEAIPKIFKKYRKNS